VKEGLPNAPEQFCDELRAREVVVGLERDGQAELLCPLERGLEPARDVVQRAHLAAEDAHDRSAPRVGQLEGGRKLAVERPRELDRRVERDERHRGVRDHRRDRAPLSRVDRQWVDRLPVEQPQLEPVVAVLGDRGERPLEGPPRRREVRERDPPQCVRTFPERRSASSAA
jgi:hypothetical protein